DVCSSDLRTDFIHCFLCRTTRGPTRQTKGHRTIHCFLYVGFLRSDDCQFPGHSGKSWDDRLPGALLFCLLYFGTYPSFQRTSSFLAFGTSRTKRKLRKGNPAEFI